MLKLLAQTNRIFAVATAVLFDSGRYYDYLIAAIVAAVPIGAAALAGVLHDRNGFTGYLSSRNWTSLVLILPALLWVLRWIVRTLAPMSGKVPPVVELFGTEPEKRSAGQELKDVFLSPLNVYATVGLMLMIQLSDMAEVLGLYLRRFLDARHLHMEDIREPDWSVMRILDNHIGPVLANFGVTVIAYTVQFTVGVLGFLMIVLLLRHNLYFLSRIYQRRRAERNTLGPYIIVDWNNLDRRFGFGGANHAFNCEVRVLALAGTLLLFSRYHNVPANQSQTLYDAIPALLKLLKLDASDVSKLHAIGGTLPDVGQWVLLLSWFLLLGVISIPAGVKFLPFGDRGGLDMDRTRYLKEFLPDARWPGDDKIDEMAGKFAKNSFWPTGDDRAHWLFGISMTVFFLMIVPLRPIQGKTPEFLGCCVTFMALGFGTAAVVFRLLKASLAYIDSSLVEPGAKP